MFSPYVSAQGDTPSFNWTPTDLTVDSYNQLVQDNLSFIRGSVTDYLRSTGASKEVLGVAGVAAQIAHEGSAKLYSSDGLSMDLTNITSSGQGLSVSYSLEW